MKAIILLTLLMSLLPSCAGRSGYYDGDQKGVIALLCATEWRVTYEHVPAFDPQTYDGEGWCYSFSADGKGWREWKQWDAPGDDSSPQYFQWTFTNGNFTVVYLGGSIERFWLIEKLTATELHVIDAVRDPVLYPGTDQTILRLSAAR